MTACSDASRALAEPLAATAPVATTWLVLEQPGPWGRKALTQSHLDPVLGKDLEDAADAQGCRVALARRPGRHPDSDGGTSRRVWLASTRPGATWLLGGRVEAPEVLRGLDWTALGHTDRDAVRDSLPGLRSETEPLLLVCTNGRRDVCCALRGRPLIESLRGSAPERVWETTHLGGHRFAPTAVILPHGVVHGRLDADTGSRLLADARAGRFVPDGYRGRSTYPRPGQAAEAAVRAVIPAAGLDDLDLESTPQVSADRWEVTVRHRDGRRWVVDVERTRLAPARPESCGAEPGHPTAYRAGPPRPTHQGPTHWGA